MRDDTGLKFAGIHPFVRVYGLAIGHFLIEWREIADILSTQLSECQNGCGDIRASLEAANRQLEDCDRAMGQLKAMIHAHWGWSQAVLFEKLIWDFITQIEAKSDKH